MKTILDYFARVQALVSGLSGMETERYEEQVLSTVRGNLRMRLRFSDNSLLEVSEAVHIVGGSMVWLSYRYHYQRFDGSIVFRYDNTPHHPELSTHPEHKHKGASVQGASRPDMDRVIEEVREYLEEQKV